MYNAIFVCNSNICNDMNISITEDRIVDASCVEEGFPMEEDSTDNYRLKVPKLCGALICVLLLCRMLSFSAPSAASFCKASPTPSLTYVRVPFRMILVCCHERFCRNGPCPLLAICNADSLARYRLWIWVCCPSTFAISEVLLLRNVLKISPDTRRCIQLYCRSTMLT